MSQKWGPDFIRNSNHRLMAKDQHQSEPRPAKDHQRISPIQSWEEHHNLKLKEEAASFRNPFMVPNDQRL